MACSSNRLNVTGTTSFEYFDQQLGALHTLRWSKLFFLMLKQLYPLLMEQNEKKKKRKPLKNMQKNAIKEGSTRVLVLLFNAG